MTANHLQTVEPRNIHWSYEPTPLRTISLYKVAANTGRILERIVSVHKGIDNIYDEEFFVFKYVRGPDETIIPFKLFRDAVFDAHTTIMNDVKYGWTIHPSGNTECFDTEAVELFDESRKIRLGDRLAKMRKVQRNFEREYGKAEFRKTVNNRKQDKRKRRRNLEL